MMVNIPSQPPQLMKYIQDQPDHNHAHQRDTSEYQRAQPPRNSEEDVVDIVIDILTEAVVYDALMRHYWNSLIPFVLHLDGKADRREKPLGNSEYCAHAPEERIKAEA